MLLFDMPLSRLSSSNLLKASMMLGLLHMRLYNRPVMLPLSQRPLAFGAAISTGFLVRKPPTRGEYDRIWVKPNFLRMGKVKSLRDGQRDYNWLGEP